MSLTSYPGDSIDLRLTKALTSYTGDSIALALAPAVPTVNFTGSTTLDLRGKVDQVANFSVTTASTTVFEQPYRDFQISTGSVFLAQNPMASPQIATSSTMVFRAGVTATINTGSTIDARIWASIMASTVIPAQSITSIQGRSFANVTTAIRGSTYIWAKSGYIQPIAFVVQTESFLSARSSATKKSAFVSAAKSTLSQRASARIPASFAATTTSALAHKSAAIWRSQYAESSGTSTSLVGQKGALAAAVITPSTSFAFSSATITLPLPDMAIDTTYVRQVASPIYVRTVQ